MGFIEECDEDYDGGKCESCKKETTKKCNGCKKVFFCSRQCLQNNWKFHKGFCKSFAYKIEHSNEMGKYIIANRDLKEGEILWKEAPLSYGPTADTIPICLNCYAPVNGSYKCKKTGWPFCNPECRKAASKNPEVVIPLQTEAEVVIDSYDSSCYLYDAIAPLRILLLQKTSPKKFGKIMSLESHFEERKKADPPTAWKRTIEKVIDVMKKTLGIMVFEVLYKQFDFSDDTIQRINGILETNAIEIRLAASEIQALYELTCLLEHSCCPNIRMTFDDKYHVTVRAGRNIKAGEHLCFMYTHSLWGTMARREHLYLNKFFWCKCLRCEDPSEYGSNISTLVREEKELLQRKPLEPNCPWTSRDGSVVITADEVMSEMSIIGAELALLQLNGTVDEYIQFIDKYEVFLHSNHYHLLTAKHSLLQMLGRSEGHLIQDLPEKMLKLKEDLCRQVIDVCKLIDPSIVRLQIYVAVALYELHLPLLQILKRKWENGGLPTEEFRKELQEPRDYITQALDLLKDEVNENLPEGVMRLTVKDTLSQLDLFMKSVGCEEA
uniref:Protein msta, isoform Alike [Acyrthosiphon pisum] n=1 Tax=Lepeophtheirus salmonis TaxID=72036 RepID=A0A0K2U0Z8_LEPSM